MAAISGYAITPKNYLVMNECTQTKVWEPKTYPPLYDELKRLPTAEKNKDLTSTVKNLKRILRNWKHWRNFGDLEIEIEIGVETAKMETIIRRNETVNQIQQEMRRSSETQEKNQIKTFDQDLSEFDQDLSEFDQDLSELLNGEQNEMIENMHVTIMPLIEANSCFDIAQLIHYIPHKAIFTPQKQSTKVRMVFDISTKTSTKKSYNDLLYKGSVMLENVIIVVENEAEAISVFKEVKEIFKRAVSHDEFISNSKEFNESLSAADRQKRKLTQVLGIHWNTKQTKSALKYQTCQEAIKRSMLSQGIASIFGPLGLIARVALPVKNYTSKSFGDKIVNDWHSSSLIFSKARLCPVKRITAPECEVRAINFVINLLETQNVKKFLWSDSMCVLKWIQIHLEVVIGRRGTPETIMSDNAPNFKAMNEIYNVKGYNLNEDQIETILNFRPLTQMTKDSIKVLRPIDFINPLAKLGSPFIEKESDGEDYGTSESSTQEKIKKQFRKTNHV
ncbi:hypothetical protein DINM_003518 [Dirofilaria immitis]|nr:hypothetical protein [Dirofilaria immitis]